MDLNPISQAQPNRLYLDLDAPEKENESTCQKVYRCFTDCFKKPKSKPDGVVIVDGKVYQDGKRLDRLTRSFFEQ